MTIRGRRTKRARGRGRSNPPQASTSLGVKVDQSKIQKKRLIKGFYALDNNQKSTPFNSEQSDEDKDYNDGDDEEMQLIMDEINQQKLPEHEAADANNVEKCIESSFGLSNNVRPSSGGSHVETDRRKVTSLEGISNSQRVTRSHGRGRNEPLGSSQSGIDLPLQPVQTSVSLGVKNGGNRIPKKGRGKGVDILNNKQKSTAFNSEQNDEHCINNDGEDGELQLIVDKICRSHLPKQQATGANNMEKSIGSNFELSNKAGSTSVGYHVETDARKVISVEGISNPGRGRGIKRGRGRGRSNPSVPSKSCVDPPPPPPPPPTHTSVSPGFQNDSNRGRGVKRGRGRGRSDPPVPSKSCVDPPAPPPTHTSVSLGVQNDSNRGRGIKRGRGRGRSDPAVPSKSCIDQPPQPAAAAAYTSVSPGFQNVNNRVQRKGLAKGFDALNNKQKATAFYSEQNDEYYDFSDSEDEEIQRITEKIYQRQLLKQRIANSVKQRIANFGLSNNVRPLTGGSHIEADRRNVVSVEGIPNQGRRIKQGRGRGPLVHSQSCIDQPPQPAAASHTLVSPGFKNVYNRVQRKEHVRGFDALNNKQKATAFISEHSDEYYDYSDGEEEEIQVITENARPSCEGSHIEADRRNIVSVEGISNPGRGIKRGRGRGYSDPPEPSQLCIDPQSASALNGTTPVDLSPTHETPHQLPTSKQCVGRESTQYWTVEAIDPQGAIKKIQLKYWLVNDLPIGLRVIVNFDDQGAAFGEAQGLLAGYCGTLATNCKLFPINFERWSGKSGVPKTYLDNCFETELKPRFQFRTTESLAKRYCKLSIAKKWAAYRQSLWTRFYDPSKTLEQIISDIPLGVDPIQWAHFVDYRLKPETLEICRKNKENRSKQVIPHTGGSKPLSRKRHEMFLKNGQQPCRGKLYIETHKKKDGSFVNDAAERIAEQIEEALAQSSVDELEMSPNDVVGKVFGPEHSGRVRCMGMGAAPTNTFRDSGVRLSILRNSSTDAATSSSNFWQEKYTHLESQVQNAMTAFKAYIIMKEGRVPDEMANIFDSSNAAGVASEPNLPSNSRRSRGGSNI
ncbi:uncharacterized protein LOC131651372 isoform X2 [Vicia villosa]|uniref:uncharacterized protein LOC131651372 isoform X2 n=1 Tax=Vicia villosa TaxID=3911 RepID=UPI00273BF4C7|nr:uncharacterized protein LOC131651372 isoform X2 [Vicia villosa]